MFWLIYCRFFLSLNGTNTLSQCTSHETLELVYSFKTVLQVLEISNIFQKLLCIRITTDLYLLNNVDISFSFLCHINYQLYKDTNMTKNKDNSKSQPSLILINNFLKREEKVKNQKMLEYIYADNVCLTSD